MADFSAITSRLYTGAAINDDADVHELLTVGIDYIIDCRVEFDDKDELLPYLQEHKPRVHYLFNGTADDGSHKPPKWFADSIRFALNGLSHPRHKVYAHCAAGVNRGPSTAYAILRAIGFDPAASMTLVKTGRPQAQVAYAADADEAIKVLGY